MAIVKIHESTLPTLATIYLAVCSLGASAQLLGCDDVTCPLNAYGVEYCPIGNITATNIGITNLSTAISPEPLTWTTTISSSAGPTNSSLGVYQRGYYLGTPPSLNLQETTNVGGCALFFEAISSSLHFPLHHLDTDVGTCQDALGSSCVSDLMSQVNGKFSELITATNETSSICSDLESALRDSAPRTCNATNDGSWGTINARGELDYFPEKTGHPAEIVTLAVITGSSAPLPLQQGNCHPTTGANYSLSLVETYELIAEPISTIVDSFGDGVTPILTVFYSPNSTTGNTKVSSYQLEYPEFHLSCLRPVGQSHGPHEVQGGLATLFQPDLRLAAMLVLVASAVAVS